MTDGRVTLSWSLDSPSDVREVQVERREVGQGQYQVLTPHLVPGVHMEYIDVTVQPGTAYEYRVTALGVSGGSGQMSFRVTTPAATFRVYGVAPNPFRDGTTIRYSVAKSGPATVDVLNVRGSMVRRLVDGMQDAGAHEIAWDGLTAENSPASAGIYFIRLASAGRSTVRRVVRLR
jgi:hypothetical protein